MVFRYLTLALALVVLNSCSIFGGGDYLIRAEGGVFNVTPDGDIGLSNIVGVVSKNSLDDIGLDDTENSPYAKVNARLGSSEFELSGFQSSFSGTGTLTVGFGGITAGAPVSSDLDVMNANLRYTYYILDLDNISIGPGVGVEFFDLDAEVSATGFTTEDFGAQAPIPVVGASAVGRFDMIRAYANLFGVSANVGDLDGTYLDFEAGVKVVPIDYVDVFAGYRSIMFQAEGTDGTQSFDVDFELPGFFFGAGFRF